MSFLPPTSYSELTTQQKQSFSWLTRNLHGIEWDTGLSGTNNSKRSLEESGCNIEEKIKFLPDLLDCSLIDMNSLACPSISVNYFTQNCRNHSKGKNIFNKHFAKEKAIFYFNWLTIREELTKVEAPLSPSSTICALITGDGNLSISISKDETIKTGNQFLQRKVKLLLTEDEIRSFTFLVYYIEPFLQWRKQNVKNSTQSLSSETLADVETPGW